MNTILSIYQSVIRASSDNSLVEHVGLMLTRPDEKTGKIKQKLCVDFMGGSEMVLYKDPNEAIDRAVVMPVPDVIYDRVALVTGVLQSLGRKSDFPFYFSRDMRPNRYGLALNSISVTTDGYRNTDYVRLSRTEKELLSRNPLLTPLDARARVNCVEMTRFVLQLAGLVSDRHVGFLAGAMTGTEVKNRIQQQYNKHSQSVEEIYSKTRYSWTGAGDQFRVYAKVDKNGRTWPTDVVGDMKHVKAGGYETLWDRLHSATPAPVSIKDSAYIEWPPYILARLKKNKMIHKSGIHPSALMK